MSSSAQKNRLNRDAVGDNQSIFDFLKRKKQFNLQNTINKSYQGSSNTKRKADIDIEDEFPQTRDLTKYRTYETSRIAQTSRQAVTPQKIDFEDQKQTNRSTHNQASPVPAANNRRGKSFLSMISPIKNRTNSALQERQDPKEKENRSKSGMKGGKAQNFTKGKVTKCINSIKETVLHLNDNVRRIQQKSHGLTVQFNPIFNKFSESTDPLSRQVGDLRNKLKAFDSLVNGVSIENCDEMVQNFHRNMEDHIQSELHHLKKELQKAKSEQISSIHEDRQAKIDKLQADLKKMTKDNELLVRRLQKAENLHEKVEETFSQKRQSQAEQLDRYKQNYESTIDHLKDRNAELQEKLQYAQERAREAEKSYKNERMVKENIDDRYKQEIQQITEAKDAYLLNEIMVLKAEFNADIARINDLHKVKEAEFLNRLNKREQEIDQKMFEKGCDKQIQSKILEQASQLKQENIQLKNKSQCIVTDMYRMNEELYQHWMALKDIKALSTRLGSFAQFRKIYDDVLFNDHLFH